jgi:hypothetical protein
MKADRFSDINDKSDIGNDIILDHQFKRNNITENFLNCSSMSN